MITAYMLSILEHAQPSYLAAASDTAWCPSKGTRTQLFLRPTSQVPDPRTFPRRVSLPIVFSQVCDPFTHGPGNTSLLSLIVLVTDRVHRGNG